MEVSATVISNITDKVIPALNEWRNRPLKSLYPFVFLDCMHYKVKYNGCVQTRAVYNILGVNRDGRKGFLGIYLSENEGSKFWLSVLMDLKQRGVEDIQVASVDGLKAFPDASKQFIPKPRFSSASFPRYVRACGMFRRKIKKPSWQT